MNTSNAKYLAGFLLAISTLGAMAQPEQSGSNDALNVATAIQSTLEVKSGLSDSAHHIRVTATDSKEVYLQGKVASTEERAKVDELASSFLSDYTLRDQLIVSSGIDSASNAKSSVRLASR